MKTFYVVQNLPKMDEPITCLAKCNKVKIIASFLIENFAGCNRLLSN